MSQRSRVWPYVLILGCLFVMALVAPHGWDHFGPVDFRQSTSEQAAPAGQTDDRAVGTALIEPEQSRARGPVPSIDSTASATNSEKLSSADSHDPAGDDWQFDAAAGLNESDGNFANSMGRARVVPTSAADAAKPVGGEATSAAGPAFFANQSTDSPAASLAADSPTKAAASDPQSLELLHRDVSVVGEMLANEFSNTLHALQAKSKSIANRLEPKPEQSALSMFPFVPAKSKPNDLLVPPRSAPDLKPIGATPQEGTTDAVRKFGTAKASDMPGSESAEASAGLRAWPVPESLLRMLDNLAQQDDSNACEWADSIERDINGLDRLPPHAIPQAAVLLKHLRSLSAQADSLAVHTRQIQINFAIHRAQYALVRRLDIWDVVCLQRQMTLAANTQSPLNRRRMELALADVNSIADRNGEATGLRENLMLDTLAELARRDDAATAEDRRHVAREVIGRIAERRQAAGREQLAEERPLTELDRQLRRWASEPSKIEPTDGQELMALVERFESRDSVADAHRLAQSRIELASSTNPADNDLGRRLEMHYRNANFRVVLSDELINRLLPQQATIDSPVNDVIVGAVVQGQSSTSTALHVKLLPSKQSWQIAFEAAGNVASETSSTSGPVTFMNRGAAQFSVQKRITIDSAGIHSAPSTATVSNNTQVEGIETQYDSLPVFRLFVRNYAMSERDELEGRANQETEEKIRRQACSRVDTQIDPRLEKVTKKFRDQLATLEKLGLQPTIATLETSDVRLTARSRLASPDQLAAYTPRPDAPAGSLASMQIHESAVNNLLDRLDIAGKKFTLPDLISYLNKRLGRTTKSLPDDLPAGVEITFAKSAPFRIRCIDDHIELTINIAEIRQGKRRWHDFEVRAAYRADVHGLSAQLEREGSIELGGQYKGTTELARRGIFSKVLSRERKFSLLPSFLVDDPRLAKLQVTQLAIADGWISVAIGEASNVAGRVQSIRRY